MDQLPRWAEAFPTRKATAQVVVKALRKDLIPCFGVAEEIDADKGSRLTAEILENLYKAFSIRPRLHAPYHPQSSAQGERMNCT